MSVIYDTDGKPILPVTDAHGKERTYRQFLSDVKVIPRDKGATTIARKAGVGFVVSFVLLRGLVR